LKLTGRGHVYIYADRIVLRQDGRIIGEHDRSYAWNKRIYNPWHYVPVLARKPGALRNGAPFKGWELPGALGRVHDKLKTVKDGDRQMVDLLTAVLSDGLVAVEAACPIVAPDQMQLVPAPTADCQRYDRLRRLPVMSVVSGLAVAGMEAAHGPL